MEVHIYGDRIHDELWISMDPKPAILRYIYI